MEDMSPYMLVQRLEGQVKAGLRRVDHDSLTIEERRALVAMKRLTVEARLDVRDYELSETRQEQLACAAQARKRLRAVRAHIVQAGTAFGPADIAQLDAEIEQVIGLLT